MTGPGRLRSGASALAGAALALVLLTGAASAQEGCRAVVNGTEVVIAPDAVQTDGPGLTERVLGWPRRTWNRAWGTPPACDSAVLLTFLAGIEGLAEKETAGYCLSPLDDEEYLLVPGERGLTGRCTRTFCERVTVTATEAAGITARLLELATGDEVDGLESAAHASGALLLSGPEGLLAPVFEGAAQGLGALLANPAVAATAAVTVLAAGGALYVCS